MFVCEYLFLRSRLSSVLHKRKGFTSGDAEEMWPRSQFLGDLQVSCQDFRDPLWKVREKAGPRFSLCGQVMAFPPLVSEKKRNYEMLLRTSSREWTEVVIASKEGRGSLRHPAWWRWVHPHKHKALFSSNGFAFATESLSAPSHKLLTALLKGLSVSERYPFMKHLPSITLWELRSTVGGNGGTMPAPHSSGL